MDKNSLFVEDNVEQVTHEEQEKKRLHLIESYVKQAFNDFRFNIFISTVPYIGIILAEYHFNVFYNWLLLLETVIYFYICYIEFLIPGISNTAISICAAIDECVWYQSNKRLKEKTDKIELQTYRYKKIVLIYPHLASLKLRYLCYIVDKYY